MTLKQHHIILTNLSEIQYQAEKRNKHSTSWANFKSANSIYNFKYFFFKHLSIILC